MIGIATMVQVRRQVKWASGARYAFGLELAVLLCLLSRIQPAAAQALTYGAANRTIRVCNLVLASQEGAVPTAPYLFYLLDSRPDLKPAGWQLENPMAPPRADNLIRQRWGTFYGTAPLGKNAAAYWEVYSSRISPEDLSQFDVIFIGGSQAGSAAGGAHGATTETPTIREREMLRRAVDAGATLWIEDAGGWRVNGRFFFGGTFATSSPLGTPQVLQPVHPLLNRPYVLTGADLQTIFPRNVRGVDRLPGSTEPTVVQGVLQTSSKAAFLASGAYGSGQIVMMGGGVASALSASISPGSQMAGFKTGNLGPLSGNGLSQVPPAPLKLAFNLMSLTLDSPQERGQPRHSGSTLEQVGAPLTRKWNFPSDPKDPSLGEWNPAYPNAAAPAVYKSAVFVPAANGIFYAFDLDPMRDIDGDGNPDDGLPVGSSTKILNDLSLGAPYDVLWKLDLGAQIGTGTRLVSSPTVGNVGGKDIVFVSTEDGTVYALDAFPTSRGRLQYEGKILWSQKVGSPYTGASGGMLKFRIPAPVLYADRLFVAANDPDDTTQGTVMELNPVTGKTLWRYSRKLKPAIAQAPPLGRISATPAIGWIYDDRVDATDLVMYVATLGDSKTQVPGKVFSFLLGVRNERLSPVAGDPKRFRSRHFQAPSFFSWLPGGRRTWVVGNPGVVATYDASAPGQVLLSQAVPAGTEVRADYDVDCSADQYKPRTTFFGPPASASSAADFMSSPVIGPDGTVYAVATDTAQSRCSLYALREQAPLAYVKWRYSLMDSVVAGPPAFYKGVLYLGTTSGRIIGFDTRAQFKIDLNGIVDTTRKFAINFQQRDPMLPANYSLNSYAYIAGQYEVNNVTTVDASGRVLEHGQILIKQFSIAGSNSLDASQPVTVRYPVVGSGNQAEETTEIKVDLDPVLAANANLFSGTAGGTRGNKVFDKAVSQGGFGPEILAGPTIAGDIMYVTTGDGNVAAFPASLGELKDAGPGNLLLPATIPLSKSLMLTGGATVAPIRAPLVAVDGNLVINSAGGVMVFHQPISLISDANRVLEVQNRYAFAGGGAGPAEGELGGSEIRWSLSSTERKVAFPNPGLVSPTPVVAAAEPELKSISHPSVSLRLNSTDFLICDTGNNRVVEVDRGGQVIWELSSFADPQNILGGSQPLTLSTPTDVQRWYSTRRDGSGAPIANETHTLVTDLGNQRVLEIRDTYPVDPRSGVQEYHVLVWASQTTSADKSYVFRNAQRLPDGSTLATVVNWQVNSVDGSLPDTAGSSVVLLSPRVVDTSGRVTNPGGRVSAFMNALVFPDGTRSPLANPVFFQRYFTGKGTKFDSALMVDGLGIYDLVAKDVGKGQIDLIVQGNPLRGPGSPEAVGAVSAKRLVSGNTLIVNQALSTVFEFDPVANKFIKVSPLTQDTYSLVQPTYADRTE
ncbi:MAG TPA: PQQ-binding-like beta-propeller repeat protein [Armatimonadota bacterium]